MEVYLYIAPLVGLLALGFVAFMAAKVNRTPPGTEKMQEIAAAIHEGAMAFLRREYRTLVFFVIFVFVALSIFVNLPTAICFLLGAFSSALTGYIGMNVATRANVRTANAARSGQNQALGIAFAGGTVMGMVGLGLLGLGVLYIIWARILSTVCPGCRLHCPLCPVGGGSIPRLPVWGLIQSVR